MRIKLVPIYRSTSDYWDEEDIDEDEQIEVEDPNLLIGEDDDYLDEEDEEVSSKELPSV